MARKKTVSELILIFNKVHNFIYDYSLFTENEGSKVKIKIICKEHGIFEQSPNHHSQGRGCPTCARIISGKKHCYTHEKFIELAEKKHNKKYIYLDKYVNGDEKIRIKCKCCNEIFYQAPRNHLEGYGCSNCAKTGFDTTKKAVLYYLKVENHGFVAYKIGITNLTVKKRFGGDMKHISIIKEELMDGSEALRKENEIKAKFTEYQWEGKDLLKNGNTELFTKDILDLDKERL